MDVPQVNGELSKSPQAFSPDLHAVMSGSMVTSAGQNLTIFLGSSAGKVQRPLLKLKRAGDINLSAAFSSSVVAKMEVSGELLSKSPQIALDPHALMPGARMTSAGQNFTISLGSSAGKTQRPLSKLRRAGDINQSIGCDLFPCGGKSWCFEY